MSVSTALSNLNKELEAYPHARLVGISKTKPVSHLQEAYDSGLRLFGENKVQEMTDKQEQLPQDIEWHMVGHLQRNKVKYLAPYVSLIHSVDSPRLLRAVNKEGRKAGRTLEVLLQMHIAKEDTKFGLDRQELEGVLANPDLAAMEHVKIVGLMGMATFTDNEQQIRDEFRWIRQLFEELKGAHHPRTEMRELSIGMTQDYHIALDEGSTMVRIGTKLFGARG